MHLDFCHTCSRHEHWGVVWDPIAVPHAVSGAGTERQKFFQLLFPWPLNTAHLLFIECSPQLTSFILKNVSLTKSCTTFPCAGCAGQGRKGVYKHADISRSDCKQKARSDVCVPPHTVILIACRNKAGHSLYQDIQTFFYPGSVLLNHDIMGR